MAVDYSICLGTAGWGVWNSPDAGNSWVRHRAPFPLNSRVQALVAHPTQARTIFAGGDTVTFADDMGWHQVIGGSAVLENFGYNVFTTATGDATVYVLSGLNVSLLA